MSMVNNPTQINQETHAIYNYTSHVHGKQPKTKHISESKPSEKVGI